MSFSSRFFPLHSSKQIDKLYYQKEIILNLQALNINQSSIDKILHIVNQMPCADHLQRVLAFLTKLKDEKFHCEPHYLYSDYIAEFFCTLSSISFFATAFIYEDYLTLALATFATLSHAFPLKILNDCDKLTAIIQSLYMASHYSLILENPDLLVAGMITFSLGLAEFTLGRKYKEFFNGSLHSAWHLAAAFSIYKFDEILLQVSQAENIIPKLSR